MRYIALITIFPKYKSRFEIAKIEGFDSVEMLKTEVPQDLFILIMQENPSRDSDNVIRIDS
ncbi:MAG: hypothetical protein ACLUKN_09260 [Bacilli bacterium]